MAKNRQIFAILKAALFALVLSFSSLNAFSDDSCDFYLSDNYENCVVRCEAGYIVRQRSSAGCAPLKDMQNNALLDYMSVAGYFNFLRKYPEYSDVSLYAAAQSYLQKSGSTIKDLLYSSEHFVPLKSSSADGCPVDSYKDLMKLNFADDCKLDSSVGSSFWYMIHPNSMALNTGDKSVKYNIYDTPILDYKYNTNGAVDVKNTFVLNETVEYQVKEGAIKYTGLPPIALCPMGTKLTGDHKSVESCNGVDTGASYDIIIYTDKTPFTNVGIIGFDRFILREVFGKGWTAVIEDKNGVVSEIVLADYSATSGIAQEDKSLFYMYGKETPLIYPAALGLQDMLNAMFMAYEEYFTNQLGKDVKFNQTDKDAIIYNLTQEKELHEMLNSSTFGRSTRLHANILYNNTGKLTEITYDNIPHHTSLTKFQCNSNCDGVEDTGNKEKFDAYPEGGGEEPEPTVVITLNWNENGGNTISNGSCTLNENLTLPSAPTRSGYTFTGWKLANGTIKGANTTVSNGCVATYTGVSSGTSTSITAQWTPVTITINWDENGGNAIANGSCTYGGNLTLPSAPTRSGYTFNGWKLANGTIKSAGETVSGGCTITYTGVSSGISTSIQAQWAEQTCTNYENSVLGSFAGSGCFAGKSAFNGGFSGVNSFLNDCENLIPADASTWMVMDLDHNVLYGETTCINTEKTTESGVDSTLVTERNLKTGNNCWCRVTKTKSGSTGAETAVDSSWFYVDSSQISNYSDCKNDCARGCADMFYHQTWRDGTNPAINESMNICPTPTVVNITINWDENGGNAIANGSCTLNSDLTLPSAPTRSGYTFNGWKLADNSIHNAGETVSGGCTSTYTGVSSGTSTSITAQWTPATITINWDENGGGAVENGSCVYGGNLTLPSAPTRDEYTFAGWKLADGTIQSSGGIVSGGCTETYIGGIISSVATGVQAQWTQPSCPINYHSDQSLTEIMGTSAAGVDYVANGSDGQQIGSYGGLSSSGAGIYGVQYAFAVYYGENKGFVRGRGVCSTKTGTNYTVINTSLPDNSGPNCYCQLYDYTSSGVNISSGSLLLSSYADAGQCANNCSVNCAYAMRDDSQLALFLRTLLFDSVCSPDVYRITYNTNGGNTIDPYDYTYGSSAITLPEPTRPEYTFAGWYSDSELTNLVSGPYTPTQSVTLYAKWTENLVHCDAGYYLPANATQCTACTYGIGENKWCPGGDFEISSEPQGLKNCPEIQNYGGAAALQPIYAVLFGPVDYNKNNIKDTERDCGVLFGYSYDRDNVGSVIDSGLGMGSITNNIYSLSYNTNSAYNRNIAWATSNCLYNPDTGLYDYCLPSDVWVGVVCKNGYYVPQNKIHTNFNTNSSENFFGEFDTSICVPAESGYYTNLYDLHKNDENNALANKVGVGTSPLSGAYKDIITGSTDEFTNLYKKCPDAYPDSDIASWQVAQCYATVTFMDGSTELKTEQHDFDGTSDGVNVTTNAYHISDYQPTKTGYVFVGWYETSDFSSNKITTETDLTGNKTLYAKWTENLVHCDAGWFLPAGRGVCSKCQHGDNSYYIGTKTEGYWCPGGDFEIFSANDQGLQACPSVADNTGAMWYEYISNSWMDADKNKMKDKESDCVTMFTYSSYPNKGFTSEIKSTYNATAEFNIGNALSFKYCFYNQNTGRYDICYPPTYNVYAVCAPGYKIKQSEMDKWIGLGTPGNFVPDIEERMVDMLGPATNPCELGEANHYTNMYDLFTFNPDYSDNAAYADIMGVTAQYGQYLKGFSGQDIFTSDLDEVYKSCPTEYPSSEAGSWQVAQCYATVTFMDGSTELKTEQHDFDGTSDGVTVTTNAYHISDYQPTKTDYVFDGWYETSSFSGNKITTSTDLSGNKTLYAKWTSNIIHCNVGYYLPAGSRECAECNDGYYCPDSRDYDYNETTPQGNVKCPAITNVKEGFYYYGPDELTSDTRFGGDINLRDNVGDCFVVGFYTNFPAEMTTLIGFTQKENYNPNLDVNQTVFDSSYNCAYNSSTDTYDRCILVSQICKNGYYVSQSEANNYTFENIELNTPTPCVPAERGYYTNAYDTIEYKVANNVELEDEAIIPYRDKIGVLFGILDDKYTYVSPIDFTESTLSDWYKQCPDAYPDSEPASWQVAQCYATVTFMDGSTELKTEQHDFSGTSDGVTVTTNAYHISDYQPTKTDYVFDGWYETSDFSDNKITTTTDLSSNKTLYAKWRLDSCSAGEYKNENECSPCPEGFRDGTDAASIYMCYKSGTVNCSDYISVPNATITTQNVSATCKTYYGTDVCQLDNLDACKIISFSCNTGYEEQDIPLSATDTNFLKVITKIPNTGICYDYLTFNEVSCDSDGFNKVAPGDWSATYNNGALYGKSLCSVTTGTNSVAGNPDTTITGDNCWCRTDRFNDESAISSWVYLSVPSCESNCAQNCSVGFQMNQSMRENMFNTLNKECVPSVYTVTYNTNGGSAVSSVNYTVGSPAITLPTTTKENYIFDGWYSDSELTDIVNSPYTPTQSVTLHAKWRLDSCGAGEYKNGNECSTCPEGFRDGTNASNINECFRTDNISCTGLDSVEHGTGVYANTNTVNCTRYFGNQSVCIPDSDLQCDALDVVCDNGYRKTGVGLPNANTSLTTSNTRYYSIATVFGKSSDDTSGMARGDWDATFTYGTVKGTAMCSSTNGSFGNAGNPSTSGTKKYCWCNTTGFIPNGSSEEQTATSAWMFSEGFTLSAGCSTDCAKSCATAFSGDSGTTMRANTYSQFSPIACEIIDYNITYELDNGSVSESNPETYNIETPTFTLHNPTKENYTFIGWCEGDADCADPDVSMDLTVGSIGDKTFYAKWSSSDVHCDPGYYLPANQRECAPCNSRTPDNVWCPGGTFRIQNKDMGFQNCPEIQNYGSAAFVRPIYAMVFGYIDSNNNEIKDLETDCGVEFVYSYDANNVGIPVGDGLGYNLLNEVSSSYDANSDYNRNIAWTLSDCSYNSTTGLYDRCFPSKFWIGTVCKNGYYIPQVTPFSQSEDLHDYMDVFDTGVCVPAESGYYTNLYDLHKNDENNALANKVGVATGVFGSYSDAISNSNTEFTNLYKKCPDAYPESNAGSWQVADCYATLRFIDGTNVLKTETHSFSGTSDGVNIAPAPYHMTNYSITKTDYTFDGWYDNPEFDGEPITTSTDLTGNVDLYAKFTLERCPAGQYKSNNVCEWCPEEFRDGTNGDSINDCYKNDTISCSVVNPYTSGVGTAIHNQSSTSCKIYYNNQSVCVPDNATECMVVALECPTGYKQTGTSLATMDLSLSADSTRYNTSSGMASGDWDATFPYGTVKGTTFCSSESADYGTVKELGTESGKNCWCKLQEFTPNSHVTVPVQDATTPYVFNYAAVTKLECNNMCAWYCAVGVDGVLGTNWTESFRIKAFNATQPLRCTAIDYNITYELDGGVVSESNPETYNIETPTFTLHNPTKENYTFIGWCEGDADCADPDVSMNLTVGSIGDKTFYAKWEKASYAITYEMNGGTNYVGAPTSYVFGTGATIDGIPTRGNIMVPADPHYEYVFMGWCTDVDLNNCSMTQTISATDSGNKIFYAKWDFYYRIAFHDNFMPEATGNMNTIFVPYTQEIQLPENQYSVPGYDFAGWCYAGEERGTVGSDPVPGFECMNNDKIDYADKAFVVGLTKYNNKENYNDAIPIVELYAQWTPHHYTVEFNANGGSGDMSSQDFVYGTNQNLNANQFIRNGYDFAGWCTTPECTDDDGHTLYSDGQSVGNLTTEDNGVINLYAQWTIIEYSIKYYDGTNELSDITPATYTYSGVEDKIIVPIEPEKRGYTFFGWCVGADNCDEPQKTFAIPYGTTGNVNAYAQWTPVEYTIKYYNGTNELSGITPVSYTYSDDENQTITPIQPTTVGYEFVGWCVGMDNCTEPQKTIEIVAGNIGNINAYAQWMPVEYTIKYYDGTNELSEITPVSYTYSDDENQTITPIEPEKRGYTFNGWCVGADNCDNAQKTFAIPYGTTGNINAYAQWTSNVYNINYYDWENELGGVYPNTYTYSASENQIITPNKPSKNGYEFVGWCVGVDGCDEPVDVLEIPADTIGDIDLYAKWVMTISIHFDKNTQKDVIDMPNDVVCVYGQNCVSNQTPVLNNYEFNSWNLESDGSGDAITKEENGEYDLSNVFYFSGSENVTLYAQWTPVEYTITYDLDGGNATNPTSYNVETPIFTLNNPTKNGYEFIGWCETENCSTPELEYSFDTSIGGNKTLYAIFNPIRYTIIFDANGGYGYKEPVTCYYDSDCDISNGQIARDGYVFTGWSRNTDTVQYPQTSNGISVFNLTNVPETILFNAIWSANVLPLKYNHNDGTNIINDSCVYDTSFVPTVPTRPGYVFAGWDVSVEQ